MSIGRWSARAGSIRRILPRARRISSTRCRSICAKSCSEDAQFRVAENYLLSGLGRHAPDEDIDLAVRSLFALSVQLGDKPYLMGDTPCGTDATAFGALAGILTPFFTSKLREQAEQFGNLRRLCRPHDAAILSGVCLDAAAAGGVKVRPAGLALQRRQLRLQFGDPRISCSQRRRDIGGVEFLRNVLRAIGVPRGDPEHDHLFGPRFVARRHQRGSSAGSSSTTRASPQIFTRRRCA